MLLLMMLLFVGGDALVSDAVVDVTVDDAVCR